MDITGETPIGCRFGLLPAAQQHGVFEEHLKTRDNQEHKW